MNSTKNSLDILRNISVNMHGNTFHHHSHILYDIPIKDNGFYVEIGCYAGATACLMLQKEKINVISIDLGHPVPYEIVEKNIKKFNKHNNFYNYIKGNSNSVNTLNNLKQITKKIDILFIDGDHSYQGIINDFLLYQELVIPNGWIVFDDYNDDVHSPEVKPAVNYILNNFSNYQAYGTMRNIFKASPEDLLEGNCFLLRKNNE
jgi:predicted O-methyltransferase YrrM